VSDYDSPWKEALEQFFPAFLAFFFPKVFVLIDWSRGYEGLDKEFQQIAREAVVGRRHADKLFKVWLKDGQETWILIHIEVQSQRDEEFPERMYVYHYRVYDRFRRPVISLAILGDEDRDWRPDRYTYSLGGCSVDFVFPIAKLLDYDADLAVLETSTNPFAPLVLAHLKTMETRGDPTARRGWKWRVIKGLYERGFSSDQVRDLFRLIDWMMDLPSQLEEQLQHDLSQFEEEKQMPYVTSIERMALAKGKAEGKAESLLQILEQRFRLSVPPDLDTVIRSTGDLTKLERWTKLAFETNSLEEFRRQAQL